MTDSDTRLLTCPTLLSVERRGGCNPKTSPKFEICGSLRFLGFFRFFSVFYRSELDKKFQLFKNHVNNEVLRGQKLPNYTLNVFKAPQMSHKSYYNQQKPLNKNPLINQSKFAKMEKPKKTKKTKINRKKPKKTVPYLKFALAFGSFGLQPTHTPPPPQRFRWYFKRGMEMSCL